MKSTIKEDKKGNPIGDGSFHAPYEVMEFPEYPSVSSVVDKSETTESVYVRYYNGDNEQSITVRFSNHTSNAQEFGDVLSGDFYSGNEILFHLGIKKREFVPDTKLEILSRQVKKIEIADYQMADISIQAMYAMGEDADLSKYTGKIAKGGNWMIIGTKVNKVKVHRLGPFGQPVEVGHYIYI